MYFLFVRNIIDSFTKYPYIINLILFVEDCFGKSYKYYVSYSWNHLLKQNYR